MTPQEKKAKDLVEKFTQTIWETGNTVSKPMVMQCAIILCQEAAEFEKQTYGETMMSKWWDDIRKEIEKL